MRVFAWKMDKICLGMERTPTKNYPEFRAILESSNLPEVVRDNLKPIIWNKLKDLPGDHVFSMLDVGSSDGEMSLPLVESLKGNFNNFKYTAIEPEESGFQKLNQRIQVKGITYAESHNVTIEQYLDTRKADQEMFDFILFSHVFYHVPKDKWDKVISGSLRLLKQNGFIVAVLDSFDSQAYKLLDLITENKTRVDTLEFGNLYSAEDMEEFLTKRGMRHSIDQFSININIPKNEQKLSNLARCLAFMYRVFPDRILADYKDELEEFLKETKTGGKYIVEDVNKVIVLNRFFGSSLRICPV